MKVTYKAGVVAALGLFVGAASLPSAGVSMGREPETGLGSKQCFRVQDVVSFKSGGERKVNILANISDYYQLDLIQDCPGLEFEQGIGLQSRQGNSFICEGREVAVLTSARSGGRCEVSNFRRMSAEEVAALPTREKP